MTLLLFEDEHVAGLYPVALAKPAYAVSCGGERLIDLLAEIDSQPACLVRPHLRAFTKSEVGGRKSDSLLIANARLVPSADNLRSLRAILDAGRPGIVRHGSQIAAALVNSDQALGKNADSPKLTADLANMNLPSLDANLPLIEYPHDVLRHHMAVLGQNLDRRILRGDYSEIRDGVFAAGDVKLGDHVVTDTTRGPIVLETGVTIGPFAFLRGPVYIERDARVNEHAAIKDATVLGRTTRIGGEVEASIVEPFTNKQHHGFLGHSYLGSWINLGAGTTNSDLKNTYGEVALNYGGRKIGTGMQFVGCFVGDYTKTAINTAIFTGKTLGVCSMVYGYATTNVPSFVNYARTFGQVSELPAEVAIETQKRSFARRDVVQQPRDAQLIRDLYELTRPERDALGPLSAGPPTL